MADIPTMIFSAPVLIAFSTTFSFDAFTITYLAPLNTFFPRLLISELIFHSSNNGHSAKALSPIELADAKTSHNFVHPLNAFAGIALMYLESFTPVIFLFP